MLDPTLAQLLTAGIAAISCSAIAYVIAYPMVSGDSAKEKRLSSVTEPQSKKTSKRSASEAAANRRNQVSESIKDLEHRQKSNQKVTLRLSMERAGIAADPQAFYVASAISGLLCAAIAYFSLPQGQLLTTLTVVTGFVGALGLPRFILNKLIQRRQKRFIADLAGSIDIIVRGVKSGLPLNECLNIIANEAADPIGPEFKEVVEQQRLGVPLSEALTRLSVRMPLQEVRFLAIVISIQQQSGGNLAEALNNLSTVLRDRHRMAMKVKALSSEAKASAMILGSLPPGVTVMLHLSSPEYILPLFATHSGNLFLGAGLVWMGMGIFVMRKMINFKF